MLKIIFAVSLVVATLSFSLTSKAASSVEEYAFCDTCSSYNTYKSIASSYLETGVNKSVYILNTRRGEIRKFSVKRVSTSTPGFADEPGMPSMITSVRQVSVESTKQNIFDDAMDHRRSALALADDVEIPASIAASVYDVVGASYIANDIADYYNSQTGVSDEVANFVSGLAVLTGKIIPNALIIPVNFSDGSSGKLLVTGIDDDRAVSLIFDSGVDADNNSVSNSASKYKSGAFRFTVQGEAGVRDFLGALQRLGVPIGPVGSQKPITLKCELSGDGGELTCTIPRNGENESE
jgi:hypothetical protein